MQSALDYCWRFDKRGGWLAALATAVFLAGSLAAAEPDKSPAPIFAAVKTAIAKGEIEQTELRGFTLTKDSFQELPREGALLIGFDLGVGKFLAIENIFALRAVYRTARGEVIYGEHGLFNNEPGQQPQRSNVSRTVQLRAPEGYAVGSVNLRTGLNINGLSLTYLRINGTTLDPGQATTSEWVGDQTGCAETTLDGDGAPVVGVLGKKDDVHISALGLICLRKPPEPQHSWRSMVDSEQPGGQPDAPPPHRAQETYHDAERHFSFDVPAGWGKMSRTELEKIDEVLRQRGLSQLHYETGFRPLGSALGSYPYLLPLLGRREIVDQHGPAIGSKSCIYRPTAVSCLKRQEKRPGGPGRQVPNHGPDPRTVGLGQQFPARTELKSAKTTGPGQQPLNLPGLKIPDEQLFLRPERCNRPAIGSECQSNQQRLHQLILLEDRSRSAGMDIIKPDLVTGRKSQHVPI
jgi:hypothetical protein